MAYLLESGYPQLEYLLSLCILCWTEAEGGGSELVHAEVSGVGGGGGGGVYLGTCGLANIPSPSLSDLGNLDFAVWEDKDSVNDTHLLEFFPTICRASSGADFLLVQLLFLSLQFLPLLGHLPLTLS